MSSQFASGKNAAAICDRCGFRCKLAELSAETVRGRPTGIRVCPTCVDEEHPQDWQGSYPVNDPQALRDPRPDTALAASREIPDNGQQLSDLYVP